jgi:hypothetical protein
VSEHPTVPMTAPDGRTVHIDAELADTIRLVWELGATTRWSCQDHGEAMAVSPRATGHLAAVRQWNLGWAVIDFASPDDLVLFLDAAAGGGERDGYYLRMVHWAAPGAWRTGACVRDLAIAADERGDAPEPARFAVTTGRVLLPRSDLPETAARLDRWLDGYQQPLRPIDWDRVGW